MSDSIETVFVYGTLKKGKQFHKSYLSTARLISDGYLYGNFRLFNYYYPIIILGKEGEKPIKGEIYKVDKLTLAGLDFLEGHPSFYKREKLKIKKEDGNEEMAWVYLYQHGDMVDTDQLERLYEF